MKLFLLVLLLAVVLVGECGKLKSKSKVKGKMKHKGKSRFVIPKQIITLTKSQIDSHVKANEKAEQLFSNPESHKGRDSEDPTHFTETLFVREISDADPILSVIGNSDRLEMHDVIVNKWTIAFYRDTDSYRGIIGGLSLVDLIRNGDEPSSGNCCSGIRDTRMQKYPIFQNGVVTSLNLHCFDLEGIDEGMTICSRDPLKIVEFRQKVLLATIKAYFRQKGIVNVNVLLPHEDSFEGWTWRDQTKWGEICTKGKYQSPIDLNQGVSKNVDWMSLSFGFKPSTKTRVKFNGHESEVLGDFGFLSHKLEIGTRKFLISKLTFKFPSEHTILGADMAGEMLIYMMSKDGSLAIVSFLLDVDEMLNVEFNEFLLNLQIEKWNLGSEEGVEIEGSPNIDDIVTFKNNGQIKFRARDVFRRNFFWYMGSDSIPPCREEVYRFVFDKPIYLPSAQLFELKEKTYLAEIEPFGNKKKTHFANKRLVYYHEDTGKKCAENELDLVKLEENIGIKQEKKKKVTNILDLSHIKPNYLKASSKTTTYAYTGNYNLPPLKEIFSGPPTPGQRQELYMSEINSSEVPLDTKKRLIKKSIEVINGLNQGDKKYEEMVKEESPAIVISPFGQNDK